MPLRIPIAQQQTTVGMVGMPRASAPALVDPTGAAIADIGADLERYARGVQKAQSEADLQDRLGKATAELATVELDFDRDQDFRTAPQRFKEAADAIRDRYLDGVSDQAVATAFRKQFGQMTLAKSINVRKAALAKERDYNVASLDSSIDVYATQAANAKNPAERDLVLSQARIAIASAQNGGWITDVDAGQRERVLMGKIDQATVVRDMSINPSLTADKLALDPAYAANMDPVQRERWTDQAYRRADAERKRVDAEAERERKKRGDELLMDAYSKSENGTLTRQHVEQIRGFIEPTEYKSLLKSLNEGPTQRSDASAFAHVQSLVYTNPAEAERLAFQYHRNGLLKNSDLSAALSTARSAGRQEGPRSPYERERAYIVNAIKPSDAVPDPAASARFAIAIREYDDFATQNPQATAKELREKADDILKRASLIDMIDLARKTSLGIRDNPQATLDQIAARAEQLQQQLQERRISKAEFDKQMRALNDQRKAAERASGGQ